MKFNRRRFITTGLTASAGALAGAGLTGWLLNKNTPAHRTVAPLPSARPSAGKPLLNILLVVTDQERFDLPKGLPLPGHERLRETGTTFTRHHVNTTPCSPSRSNMYFGQHTQKTGMVVNLGVFPEPQIPATMPSLGHYLRANGYYTAYKGKWHLSTIGGHHELTYGRYPSSRDALEPFGFADFNADGDPHGATWTGYKYDGQIAAEAAQWLHTKATEAPNQPWMLAVNFVNPHDVMYYSAGPEQTDSRRLQDYLAPLAEPPRDSFYRTQWGFALPANRQDNLRTKPWAQQNYVDFCDMAYGKLPDTEQAWGDYQNYYFNCLRDADRHLLTLLDALDSSGQAGHTIVVFTSDHGEMAGAHGLRQKGPFMYQENTRVPLMIRHPDISQASETSALGSAVDLIPTLLGLVGVDASRIQTLYPQLAGVSLADAVQKPATKTARDQRGILFNYNTTHYIDSEFIAMLMDHEISADRFLPLRALLAGLSPLPNLDNPALFRGIHDGRYKFARYFRPSEHHLPADWETLVRHNQLELYDTNNDPGEMHNLAADPDSANTLLLSLNEKLNQLIAAEIGQDLGDELVGPAFLKQL